MASSQATALRWWIALLMVLTGIRAQSSNTTCARNDSNAFLFNANNESPCVVWSKLQSLCLPSDRYINVPPLQDRTWGYNPPTDGGNLCQCNVVAYALMAGCSWCQLGNVGTWVDEGRWKANCAAYNNTSVSFAQSVLPIPPFAFRPWNNTRWTPADAAGFARGPPILAPTIATTTLSRAFATPTASGSGTASSIRSGSGLLPTSTTESDGLGEGEGGPWTMGGAAKWGPIVGGVAGGVILLVLLVLLWRYWRQRHRADQRQLESGASGRGVHAGAQPGGGGRGGRGGIACGRGKHKLSEKGTTLNHHPIAGTPSTLAVGHQRNPSLGSLVVPLLSTAGLVPPVSARDGGRGSGGWMGLLSGKKFGFGAGLSGDGARGVRASKWTDSLFLNPRKAPEPIPPAVPAKDGSADRYVTTTQRLRVRPISVSTDGSSFDGTTAPASASAVAFPQPVPAVSTARYSTDSLSVFPSGTPTSASDRSSRWSRAVSFQVPKTGLIKPSPLRHPFAASRSPSPAPPTSPTSAIGSSAARGVIGMGTGDSSASARSSRVRIPPAPPKDPSYLFNLHRSLASEPEPQVNVDMPTPAPYTPHTAQSAGTPSTASSPGSRRVTAGEFNSSRKRGSAVPGSAARDSLGQVRMSNTSCILTFAQLTTGSARTPSFSTSVREFKSRLAGKKSLRKTGKNGGAAKDNKKYKEEGKEAEMHAPVVLPRRRRGSGVSSRSIVLGVPGAGAGRRSSVMSGRRSYPAQEEEHDLVEQGVGLDGGAEQGKRRKSKKGKKTSSKKAKTKAVKSAVEEMIHDQGRGQGHKRQGSYDSNDKKLSPITDPSPLGSPLLSTVHPSTGTTHRAPRLTRKLSTPSRIMPDHPALVSKPLPAPPVSPSTTSAGYHTASLGNQPRRGPGISLGSGSLIPDHPPLRTQGSIDFSAAPAHPISPLSATVPRVKNPFPKPLKPTAPHPALALPSSASSTNSSASSGSSAGHTGAILPLQSSQNVFEEAWALHAGRHHEASTMSTALATADQQGLKAGLGRHGSVTRPLRVIKTERDKKGRLAQGAMDFSRPAVLDSPQSVHTELLPSLYEPAVGAVRYDASARGTKYEPSEVVSPRSQYPGSMAGA